MLDKITPENIREKAQEIKRRLSTKGQIADENVICELLESMDPDQADKTDYIMEMIMDNQNFELEKSVDEAGPSKIEYQPPLQNDTEKLAALESPGRNSSVESGGIIEVSDTEDDRDYYYDSFSYNDVSLIDNTIDTSWMSPCSIYKTALDQSTNSSKLAPQTNIDADQGRAEVEFLEENNNNDVIFMKRVIYEKKRLSESPKPGCSKDLDRSQNPEEYCFSCDVDELQIDAKRIHSLLPNFNYTSIYNALYNNQLAKNRIELTLWDLLPESRPSPQLAYKRKCVPYEARSIKYKKNSEKNVTDTKPVLEKEDQAYAGDEIKIVDVLEKKDQACARDEIKVVDVLKKEEQASARNETKIVDAELKNEESITLVNEADEIKMDITEEVHTVADNTNVDMINQQINVSHSKFETDVAEAKWNCFDLFDDILKDVCDLEESVESRLASNNAESQSALNLTVPYKTETDNMHITTMSTPMPSTSTAMQDVATLNTVMPNSSMQNVTMQSTVVSSTSMPGTSMPLFVPSIAGPSIATPSTSLPTLVLPSTSMSSNAVPNVVSMSNVVTNSGTVRADDSSVNFSRMIKSRNDSPMPIQPVLSTYIRPAKFTVNKVRTPFEVSSSSSSSSSSRQSVPILKPAKLKVTNTTQSIVIPQNEILTQQLQKRLHLQLQKREAILNNRHSYEETRGRLHSSVKPVVNNTTVLPNKMLSSGKTEERSKFSIANPGPTCSLLTATTSGQSSKLVNNSPSFRIESDGKKVIIINRFHPSLKRDQSGEDKNHIRHRGNVNMLQTHDIGFPENNTQQEFTLSHGMQVAREMTRTANNTGQEIILSDKARKIYYKLIPMFPSVDTTYIKRLVQGYFTDPSQVYDETKLLQILAEHLIDNGQNYPYIKKEEPVMVNNSNTYDLNEQYADLLGIFPEADPMYLRKVAEDIYKDPEKIKEFVQSKLENPDYPTRAQYLAKKKITEQQKHYTTDFKIEQFLELFPDPFLHFENANRKCKFNPHALDFLKQYFNKMRVNTLINTYTENQHNLSLTTRTLEALTPDMKTKRSHSKMMLTEDIPLLQECAFIQHKVAIKKYLTELKEQEEKEFQELKARNELIECQCCYDNECMPSKCSSCENGHIFCNSCILRCTELILASGKTHVDCLLNCGNEFPLSVLQRILPPTKFSILLCKRQEAEVMAAGLEGLVSCPFCHFASIPPSEDKVFRCLNPDCMKESCRLCKELNHIPLKCNEVKSDAARLLLEEKMTEALVRKCYKCGRTFFKEEGCNKMTCPCGAQMCYICDKPVVDYKHFQGQGVQDSTLCPLWSDDRRMNAESVIKVCHETLKQIKQQNPQVDINVNALLPKLPPKRKGPHDDIAFANALPAHAERLARHNP